MDAQACVDVAHPTSIVSTAATSLPTAKLEDDTYLECTRLVLGTAINCFVAFEMEGKAMFFSVNGNKRLFL